MKTCLIVDDSRVVRKVARRIIEDMGFDCSEAEDGAVARDLCNENMPDVILLDWNMPNMSGIAFLQHLRQSRGGDVPKVIFCTTENEKSYIEKALKTGADEYIMKPFDGEIIATKFHQVGVL